MYSDEKVQQSLGLPPDSQINPKAMKYVIIN